MKQVLVFLVGILICLGITVVIINFQDEVSLTSSSAPVENLAPSSGVGLGELSQPISHKPDIDFPNEMLKGNQVEHVSSIDSQGVLALPSEAEMRMIRLTDPKQQAIEALLKAKQRP